MKIAQRLKELRQSRNLKQIDICRKLKFGKSAYSSYETGLSLPPVDKLNDLAEFYNVTTDYILGNTDFAISPSEMNFVNDIDLTNVELMKKYNLLVGDQEIEPETLAHWIAIIKINLKKRD